MQPTFHKKDTLIVLNKYLSGIKGGEIVIFRKDEKIMTKRVVQKIDKSFWVEGDNAAESIDSRHFGKIQKADIIGKVILTLHSHP